MFETQAKAPILTQRDRPRSRETVPEAKTCCKDNQGSIIVTLQYPPARHLNKKKHANSDFLVCAGAEEKDATSTVFSGPVPTGWCLLFQTPHPPALGGVS